MSVKSKHKGQKVSAATIIRVIIFSVIIFFLINYLSGSGDQSVLGDSTINLSPYVQQVSNLLPEKSRKALEDLPNSPAASFIQEKIGYLQKESDGFPQKQIKEIKKAIVKDIYDKIVNSIENQQP